MIMFNRIHRLAIPLFLSASAIADDAVVGSIGDINLTVAEVRELIDTAKKLADQPVEIDAESLKTLVRATLVQRLVLEKAKSSGHREKPGVAAEIERAVEAALVESYLRAVSIPADDFPAAADVSAFYEANKESFLIPKSWRVAQIFIADTDPTTTKEAEQKLATAREQLAAANADFSSVARRLSDDLASAPDGGELGWIRDDLMQPGIRALLPALAINEVSDPIRLENGWHIIRLIDAREAHTPPLPELEGRIRALLRSNKARENREAFLSGLLSEAPPAVNEIELLKLK